MQAEQYNPDWFSRPGDTIAGLMARRGLSDGDLADRLGCDRKVVQGVLAGALSIDASLALGLSRCLGASVKFWAKRQEDYDIALARVAREVPPESGAEWLKNFAADE